MEIERLSWVAKYTNNGVVITDYQGKIEWVNPSFERMMGYQLSEIIGKKPGEFLQGVDTDKKIVARISLLLSEKKPVNEILLNYTKSGRPIYVNMDIAPIKENSWSTSFICILTDLTELIKVKETQKIQETLEQRQKLLEAMAESFPDGIIGVLDQNLTYLFVGGTELKRLEHSVTQMIGDKLFDKISPEANAYAEPYLEDMFKGKSVQFEVKLKEDDYSVSAVPLTYEGNLVTRGLAVIQNITKRKLAEAETMRSLSKQRELNELKSRFVTLASHEFRTPLGTISSSAELVSKYHELQDHENVNKHLKRIKSSVKGLTEILNEFLSISKIEEGAVRNNPVEFDLVEFCEELIEEVNPMMTNEQVINYHHEGDQIIITVDKQHLKNILINLLSNAIKYSPEDKAIQFTSTLKDNTGTFLVQDNGIGIPDADQEHVFKTFYRAKNVSNIQGTGMGLHIVKRYLDIMGGTISFESQDGKGSTFRVELPQK